MRIRFWGVRGTIPTPGPDTVKYGGNTSCIDILSSDQQVIILDAGSGIRRLGQKLQQEFPKRVVGSILISHTHWDHIQGLPFFAPIFARNSRFVLVGRKRVGKDLKEVLAGQFIEPYLPYAYQQLPADLLVKEVASGEKFIIGENTKIEVKDMQHPGGCLGFRIEDQGTVLAYCSDTRHDREGLTPGVLELAQGADLLIHDAHFPEYEDAQRLPDWGHSSWLEAAQVALEANVGCLALFHYSPDFTDEELESTLAKTRAIFPRTILSQEGLTLNLPVDTKLFR